MVTKKWGKLEVVGRCAHVLKEKLKLLKKLLKEWNINHIGNIHKEHKGIVAKLNSLDLKEESTVLSEEEVSRRINLQQQF